MKTSIKLLTSTFLVMLTLSSSALADDDHSQKKVFKAAVYPATDAAKLWLCLEKYQTENEVNLELVDVEGKVIFHEIVSYKKSRQQTYRQRFDISGLGDGNYMFRITAGSQKEEFPFKLATPATVAPNRFVAIK